MQGTKLLQLWDILVARKMEEQISRFLRTWQFIMATFSKKMLWKSEKSRNLFCRLSVLSIF